MNIICTCFPSPTSISLSTIKLVTKDISLRPYLLSPTRQNVSRKRDLALQAVEFSCPPIDADCLASEFGVDGVTFSGISGSCVIRMALENGSVANVMLPSGLITSFKVPMWHGGTMELLHTAVSEGENGGAVIQGGISLAFNCQNDRGGSWSPNIWALHQVKGTAQESIQVELISRNSECNVEVRHVINLQQDVLISEILVSNASTSALRLMGSFISHLTVSTPEATYAVGLEGSDFFTRPPVLANFSIIPPDFGTRKDQVSQKFWGHIALNKLFLKQNPVDDLKSMTRNIEEEEWKGEEKDNYKHLTDKMSRIYTSAPRNFTVIDRGRRNSVVVTRDGFNELYMFSPGSRHKWYSKYSYICLGQAALLQPISINSQSEWRGGQHLHNPNF
ncbi:NDH-dependent cyclic electron flow 5 [Forsythia ovata]|uniref:NDH-dependent cyclic electron flow 5 n=1 Tax=Forsythia ovata TaxID=205694 RepID=A0ABD1PLK0_9LAMI